MKKFIRSGKRLRSGISEYDNEDIDVDPLIRDCMIREAFNMFDIDGSGDIDKSEFSKLITALGLELNEKKQNELMREIFKDGSATIDYDEFYAIMTKFQFGKESDIHLHLESAFNDFDKDLDTEINFEDFIKVSEELDEEVMTKEDAQLLVAFCKYFAKERGLESQTLGVTKAEFINMLYKINFLITRDALGKSSAGDAASGLAKSMNKSVNKSSYMSGAKDRGSEYY